MKQVYKDDPKLAVRGQIFIKNLHKYCVEELRERKIDRRGVKIVSGHDECNILTSHKKKDIDVAVIHPTSGPLLIIGVRSQMSSLSKNFLNYFEMEIGDVNAIHERFPLCVVGLLYLHPTQSILPGKEKETFDFSRAEKLFDTISGRDKASDPYGKYEEIAYLRINFHHDPPTYDRDFPKIPSLRIDNFFDNLMIKFESRNFCL